MPYEDYTNLTDKDFENLPPLVPAGADRNVALRDVVQNWIEHSHELTGTDGALYPHATTPNTHIATLRNVDIRDDNKDSDPINLGDLIREVLSHISDQSNTNHNITHRLVISLHNCIIHDCVLPSESIPINIWIDSCRILGRIDFSYSIFHKRSYFTNTIFSGDVEFSKAEFNHYVDFQNSVFESGAYFLNSLFRRGSDFSRSTFQDIAAFSGAHFHLITSFDFACFQGQADFIDAEFLRSCSFRQTSFNNYTTWDNTNFSCILHIQPKIESGCKVSMIMSRFQGARLSASDFRRLPLADALYYPRQNKWQVTRRKYFTGWLHWSRVRGIGRLQALTRASYLALLAVPLVAGAWPGVQALTRRYHETLREAAGALQIATDKAQQAGVPLSEEQAGHIQKTLSAIDKLIAETPYLPFSWLLLFLAALAVALGHLAYQTLAPQLVQEQSEDDLINAANELNRTDGGIQDERLRQALDHLRTGAELLPQKRSQWLVTRNRRTVWLPDDLDLYNSAQVPVPKEQRPDDTLPDYNGPPMIDADDQEVNAEDRKRIAIEEGEKARYEVEVFRRQPAAWLSGGLYLLGAWYLLIIIVAQFANIADAAGMASVREFVHPWRHEAAGWGTVVLLTCMLVGIVMAWDGLWERLGWGARP